MVLVERAFTLVTADDDPGFREVAEDMLCANGPFTLLGFADDGLRAVDIVLEKRPDVVLMDLQMPHMDGLQATQLIKEQDPEIKVIVVSFLRGQQYEKMALKAGAIAYVPKAQFSLEHILQIIAN